MSRAPRPAGVGARLEQRVPDLAGVLGRDQQLDAVLARVAGAADEHAGDAGDGQHRRCGSARAARRSVRPRDDPARVRALHGEHREVVQAVVERRRRSPRAWRRIHARSLSWLDGVGDRQEAVVREPVGEEVVEHAAVLAAQHASTAPRPSRELGDVVGEHALEERSASGPRGLDLAHVRDVEHAGAGRAPPCAPRGCPRTAPASPSRRTERAWRPPPRGGRTAGCA